MTSVRGPVKAVPLSWNPPGLEEALQRCLRELRNAQHVLVVAHRSPDGDAVGCTVAAAWLLEQLGIPHTAWNQDPIPQNLRFLDVNGRIRNGSPPQGVDTLLVLDCCAAHRLGPALADSCEGTKVLCLDHHDTVDEEFPDILALDAEAAACAELVYRLVACAGVDLGVEPAQALFAALQTDTGSFRYQSTRAEQMELAAILLRTRFDVWDVSSHIFESQSPLRLSLLPDILSTLHFSRCGRYARLQVTREVHERSLAEPGCLQGIINHARSIRGVEIAVLLTEQDDDSYRVSFRSRGRFNVGDVASRLGGGGHRNAAACTLNGSQQKVRDVLDSAVNALLTQSTPHTMKTPP